MFCPKFNLDNTRGLYYNMGMNTTLKGIKVKLYPTHQQQRYLDCLFGSCRYVYNAFLEESKRAYKEEGKSATLKRLGNFFHQDLTKREDLEFLKEHNTKVLKQEIINLLEAYKRFFVNGAGFPKFKSRRNRQSARFPKDAISKNTFDGWRINLTKQIRGLKFRCSRRDHKYLLAHPEQLRSVTLYKGKDGVYWASFLVAFVPADKPESNRLVGIDLGIKTLAVLSDGTAYKNPRWLREQGKRIAYLHRSLSRKKRGSKNWKKAKIQLARAYAKQARRRNTYIHQMTAKIISENQVIVLENLNVAGMVRNRYLAKALQDAAMGEARRQLKYKAQWYRRDLIEIDRFFPSSKLCHHCGAINSKLKLSDRTWTCVCGAMLDRDHNAACNIEAEGMRIAWETLPHCGDLALASL